MQFNFYLLNCTLYTVCALGGWLVHIENWVKRWCLVSYLNLCEHIHTHMYIQCVTKQWTDNNKNNNIILYFLCRSIGRFRDQWHLSTGQTKCDVQKSIILIYFLGRCIRQWHKVFFFSSSSTFVPFV